MKGLLTISVPEAAKVMDKSELFVRVAMQRQVIDIGAAEKMPGSTKYTYFISPSRLAREMGTTVEVIFEKVREIRCQKEQDTAS